MPGLSFSVRCLCNCPGRPLLAVSNADAAEWQRLIQSGCFSPLTCAACTCDHRLGLVNDQVVVVSTATPQIAGLAPMQGPVAGGNDVNIYGHALCDSELVVKFGAVAATIRAQTREYVTVVAPPQSAGRVDVSLSGAHGSHVARSRVVGGYTYTG